MRGIGTGIGLLTILLGLAGCHHSDAQLRPPPRPEELVAPPDESRFQTPPTYNKMGVNQDAAQQRPGLATPSGLPTRPGTRPGINSAGAPGGISP